ncbi:MAG: hypothetical protein JO360_14580 [Acidobacteria bacterium]|nr:hypothetical protein [Acidobacteriota bacterium]
METLGTQQAEFVGNRKATGTNLVVGIICLGLGAVMLYYAAFRMTADEGLFNKVLFIFGGACSLVGGVSVLYTNWMHRGERAALHEHGLLVERGGKRQSARWDEIAAVTERVEKMHVNGQHIYDRYLYTIEKRGGETFTLSNMVSGVDSIGRTIKRETFARMFPQALEAIERGEKISFGRVLVDTNGLEEGGARFLWTQLASVRVKDGVIEIKDRAGKRVLSGQYGTTPNAHVLLALLEKHLPFE